MIKAIIYRVGVGRNKTTQA